MHSRWFIGLGLILSMLLTACSAPSGSAGATPSSSVPSTSLDTGVPDDFSVDVTILTEEDGDAADLRNARYVVFPDGTLHYAARAGAGPNTLPPIVRRLDRRQMDGLWRRARQLGLADPDRGEAPSNFNKVWIPWEGHIYLMALTANDQYWNFTRRIQPDQELDPAMRAFIRDLAALAWAEDERQDIKFDARRYDYGPDPYAVYRENARRLAEAAEADGAETDDP
ncbi:MAG: hypothetical protein MK089_00705 [Phycisphaerales bacterium]|nr:hypothetical protein [Phycisphaerales bacterium]